MPEVKCSGDTLKPQRRRMSVSEIQTMLNILELYDIPIHDMRQDVYEDCISILEAKRDEYEYKLAGVLALITRLAGM